MMQQIAYPEITVQIDVMSRKFGYRTRVFIWSIMLHINTSSHAIVKFEITAGNCMQCAKHVLFQRVNPLQQWQLYKQFRLFETVKMGLGWNL